MDAPHEQQQKTFKAKLRYTGIIACSFISVQCLIWIILCIVGICCFYIDGMNDSITFDAFKYVYLDLKAEKETCTIVSPIIFHFICWFYLIGCCIWLLISIKLITVLYKWFNFYIVKKYLKIWLYITVIACGIDLLFSSFFLIDFHLVLRENADSISIPSYKLQQADFYESLTEDNKKQLRIIEKLRKELETEVKEYLLLKAHVKHQLFDEFLSRNTTNSYLFYNPFLKIKRKSMHIRATDFQEKLFDVTYLNSLNTAYAKKKKLEIPSAILMILFIRGVLVWIVNLIMALVIIYLYLH